MEPSDWEGARKIRPIAESDRAAPLAARQVTGVTEWPVPLLPGQARKGRTKHPGECAEDCDSVAARRVPRLPGREAASMHG
jgi:hypothetical protein